tara:strand:+ start:794 stop:964 length:171 start_codon:yes stop_codon:yes gene_type:complete
MRPDVLIKTGLLDESNLDEKDEPWKQRLNLTQQFYANTTKEKKICKKCNHQNAFFK